MLCIWTVRVTQDKNNKVGKICAKNINYININININIYFAMIGFLDFECQSVSIIVTD